MSQGTATIPTPPTEPWGGELATIDELARDWERYRYEGGRHDAATWIEHYGDRFYDVDGSWVAADWRFHARIVEACDRDPMPFFEWLRHEPVDYLEAHGFATGGAR